MNDAYKMVKVTLRELKLFGFEEDKRGNSLSKFHLLVDVV